MPTFILAPDENGVSLSRDCIMKVYKYTEAMYALRNILIKCLKTVRYTSVLDYPKNIHQISLIVDP